MADILQIGISGLRASQAALSVTGHNITNANTEGYSRQVLGQSATSPQQMGGNWMGTGVSVDTVTRVYDQFLVSQLWRDTSNFKHYEALATNAEQIDSLLADPGTGVQPGLEKMFGAMQTVVDNPASLAAREVLLSESQGLVDRFQLIDDRFQAQNRMLNGQLKVTAEEINEMARAIAELNKEIQFAQASTAGTPPNDLLDRRDQVVRKMSELVQLKVIEQDDGVWNITIGKGQPLVVGKDFNKLTAAAGSSDASRSELFLETGRGGLTQISSSITGGELGGMLEFRSTVLDPIKNELGRLALVINQSFNEQHRQGIDYDGRKGVDFFTDINEPSKVYQRVLGDVGNSQSKDRLIALNIGDSSKLTASDYRLEFPGPNDYSYRITRLSDGAQISSGSLDGVWPNSIDLESEGFSLRVDAGSFKAGDKFTLTPTRNGAAELSLNITRGEQIAVASPVVSDTSLGNRGNAKMTQAQVYDTNTPYFAKEGELNPPLKIVFTSPTTYDVLDNSDPGNPIPLFPPLMNQRFVPGISNNILPDDLGRTAFTSYGGFVAAHATYQAPAPAAVVEPSNGFAAERFSIRYTDPRTQQVTTQPLVSTPANASAKEIAAALSLRDGIEASARTTLQLDNFTQDSNAFLPMQFSLNGIALTDTLGPNQNKYASNYPVEVPEPMTPDFLADRINANYDFQNMGIVARSDGEKLTIIALNGEDLSFDLAGDAGAGFSVSNGQEIVLQETAAAPFWSLNEYDGYNFDEGGPYTYEFEVPGQGQFAIQLTGQYSSGSAIKAEIKTQLEQAGFAYTGDLEVSISERGAISFQPKVAVQATGVHGSSKMTVGGQIKVVADAGYSLGIAPPGNNLFPVEPVGEPVHFGMEVFIDGIPQVGDSFTLDYNQDGTSDSRNGVMLGALQDLNTLNDNASFSDTYAIMVERVGSITNRAQINRDSTEVLKNHSLNAVTSLSGVNLDEEAAALIRYELAYNASAQIIQTARAIFDTLIATFR